MNQSKKIITIPTTTGYKILYAFSGLLLVGLGSLGFRAENSWDAFFLFLPLFLIGLFALFKLFDFWSVVIHGDEQIEIKSLFRRRIIHKKDIIGYAFGRYSSNQSFGISDLKEKRILIITQKEKIRFLSEQIELKEIKRFLHDKKPIPGVFAKEEKTKQIVGMALFLAIVIAYFVFKAS